MTLPPQGFTGALPFSRNTFRPPLSSPPPTALRRSGIHCLLCPSRPARAPSASTWRSPGSSPEPSSLAVSPPPGDSGSFPGAVAGPPGERPAGEDGPELLLHPRLPQSGETAKPSVGQPATRPRPNWVPSSAAFARKGRQAGQERPRLGRGEQARERPAPSRPALLARSPG